MRYCQSCILPDTRPNLVIDDSGFCNAAGMAAKNRIDWKEREVRLHELVAKVKAQNATYDCIIPVSGGKDSTWQTLTALELGLNPLCVTWRTPARTKLGQENLDNLISLGVNHVDLSINPEVERRFTRLAFERFGNPLIPMHMAMHATALQFALNFKVPLIIWGENSSYEYGGPDELNGVRLNHAWLKKFGVTQGTTSEDWVSSELTRKELAPYRWPSDEEQEELGIHAIFLGYYLRWDPVHVEGVAKKHGFKSADVPKTGHYDFADIDDEFLITVHHWMKWYKFGFTRLWDNLSLEIRAERLTRTEAITLLTDKQESEPTEAIDKFCEYVGEQRSWYDEVVNRFRNRAIWEQNSEGQWRIPGFLIPDWDWSVA